MEEKRKSPVPADEQESPEPERLVTPAEEAGMDLAEMEDPPQSEGKRKESDDGDEPDPKKR